MCTPLLVKNRHYIVVYILYCVYQQVVYIALKLARKKYEHFMELLNGCIMEPIYFEWFRYSIQVIPPARPVLLVHAFNISIGVFCTLVKISIYALCHLAHTYILQPLDIGVIQSKACCNSNCRLSSESVALCIHTIPQKDLRKVEGHLSTLLK